MLGWSELPPDIIHWISLQIDNPFSLIHFRSVCSSWRSFSILKFLPVTPLKCPLPLDSGGCGDDCHILNSRVYLLKSPNTSPTPKYWLFKLEESENGEIVLCHLFARRNVFEYNSLEPTTRLSLNLLNCQIFVLAHQHLACFSEWIEGFESIMDCVEPIGCMGLDGKNNKFTILGKLSFESLAMYSSVDECWTELEIDIYYPQGIVSYKGKFYAIDRPGRTIVVEPTTLEVNTFQRSRPRDKIRRRWLIKSADKLLLVEMYIKRGYDLYEEKEDKIWFEISKLDEKRNNWEQVEDLEDHVLFLDNYCSFSCLATEIPGFRANSIVFLDMWGTSDNLQVQERILVFEFSEHGIRSLIDKHEYVQLFGTPPGWVISNE
ncbi:hypothetical protein N665_2142s0007 [Sinapis alba]|nr:hypothetical protein N665_2142s0007 [Sinapis alba]